VNKNRFETILCLFIIGFVGVAVFIGSNSLIVLAQLSADITNKRDLSIPDETTQAEVLDGVQTYDINSIDIFGIRKIYDTKPGGFEWYMNMDDPEDDSHLYNYGKIKENEDNSYSIGDRSRMSVYSEDGIGYEEGDMKTYDFSELSSSGYWYKPSDWKDVEITGEYRYNGGDGPGITHYVRSEDHSNLHDGCGGSSYKNKIYFYGTSNFNKEQAHPTSWESSHVPYNYDLKDNWFRFKTVIYNLPNGNVNLENWLDPHGINNWIKIGQFVDNGGWGDDGTKCGGAPDQIITWGSPNVTFRWDDISLDFRNLSIREIDPPI